MVKPQDTVSPRLHYTVQGSQRMFLHSALRIGVLQLHIAERHIIFRRVIQFNTAAIVIGRINVHIHIVHLNLIYYHLGVAGQRQRPHQHYI